MFEEITTGKRKRAGLNSTTGNWTKEYDCCKLLRLSHQQKTLKLAIGVVKESDA